MRTFSDYKTAMNDFGGLGGEHVENLLEGSLDADPMFRVFLAKAACSGDRACQARSRRPASAHAGASRPSPLLVVRPRHAGGEQGFPVHLGERTCSPH